MPTLRLVNSPFACKGQVKGLGGRRREVLVYCSLKRHENQSPMLWTDATVVDEH